MNSRRLEKKEKIILFSGLMVILAIIAFSFFIFIQPLRTTISQKETELATQQQLLEVIESQKIETSDELKQSSVYLQKQIPVEPLLEQFILDLEMAEIVSDSQILTVSISDEEGGESGTTPDQSTTDPGDSSETQAENSTDPIVTPKPEGIKQVTLNLSIESENYFDLEKFIETIESLDRIVEVKAINFSGPPEITSVGSDTNETKTNFQLTLSIFYYPNLQDLVDELPQMETEAPANKSNPLSNFSDVTEDTGLDN